MDGKRIHEGWCRSTTAKTTGTLCDLCRTTITGTFLTGLFRIGPGGKRLEREDYMAMKADAEQTAPCFTTSKHVVKDRRNAHVRAGCRAASPANGRRNATKAKQRAETIEANARAHAQIVKDEARRVHEENSALQRPIRSNRERKDCGKHCSHGRNCGAFGTTTGTDSGSAAGQRASEGRDTLTGGTPVPGSW